MAQFMMAHLAGWTIERRDHIETRDSAVDA
jgi:hypothetical protein